MSEREIVYLNENGDRLHTSRLRHPVTLWDEGYALPKGDIWYRLRKREVARMRKGGQLFFDYPRVSFDTKTEEFPTYRWAGFNCAERCKKNA